MKTKKVAKLLTFYFCNFKARRFKQGHKASLRLSAYNPSHTAVLSVLFAVMILSVFDNRTCTRCCSNSGNAHLARASSHFTTSPPRRPGQVSTFLCSLSAAGKDGCQVAGISENLGLCKGKWLALRAEAMPHVREELWAEAFCMPDVSCRVSLGETQGNSGEVL